MKSHVVPLYLFFVIALSVGASLALAHDDESEHGQDTALAEERREEIKENSIERRAALNERVEVRITNLAANVSNRMDAATARLQNIIDRLESRIAKLQANNIDTTAAESSLADAQAAVNEAIALLGTIDEQVADAIGSEDPKTDWQGVRATFAAIREHIKDAHQHLRATVEALKASLQEAEADRGVSEAVRAEEAEVAPVEPE